jgi:hypothetical protein
MHNPSHGTLRLAAVMVEGVAGRQVARYQISHTVKQPNQGHSNRPATQTDDGENK